MLFDLSNNQPVDIPEWAEQELRTDFPEFFSGNRPVILRVRDKYKLKSYKVPSNNHDAEPRLFVQAPGAVSIKTSANFYDKETESNYTLIYTTMAPSIINGTPSYNNGRMKIGDGFRIQPNQKDLLFYIQYMCPLVHNNKSGNKSSRQLFEYEMKHVEAKKKIDTARAQRELESLIYFDVDYSTILKAVQGLGLKAKLSEEENRVMLHDAIKNGSETFKKNAFEIIGSRTKKVEEKPDTSAHELVNRLLSENFIKNEDGMWYIRDRRGDGTKWLKNPFFESKQAGSEGTFELIDHLKVNSELLDKLRKL